jgi:hypothetical protein
MDPEGSLYRSETPLRVGRFHLPKKNNYESPIATSKSQKGSTIVPLIAVEVVPFA